MTFPRDPDDRDDHMWLMIGQKTAKCDMRVLRVPVTWFFVVFF